MTTKQFAKLAKENKKCGVRILNVIDNYNYVKYHPVAYHEYEGTKFTYAWWHESTINSATIDFDRLKKDVASRKIIRSRMMGKKSLALLESLLGMPNSESLRERKTCPHCGGLI